MVRHNAESETQRTWGDKEAARSSCDCNSAERINFASGTVRNQQIGTARTNREGRYSVGQFKPGANLPGGILSQLINETHQQIADNEAQTKNLYERLQVFESLLNQLEDQEK